jgi:hypothetical protein
MQSSLNSCQSKRKLAKITEPDCFVFERNGSPPARVPGIYLETMKTGEESTWIRLNTPSHFPNLFLTELMPSTSMWPATATYDYRFPPMLSMVARRQYVCYRSRIAVENLLIDMYELRSNRSPAMKGSGIYHSSSSGLLLKVSICNQLQYSL